MCTERRALVLTILALAATACSQGPAQDPSDPASAAFTLTPDQRQKIQVEKIMPTEFRRTVTTTGTVVFDADQATQVVAAISGPVSRLLVPLGAHVSAGEPLAEVASSDFAGAVASFRKAEAQARNARHVADLNAKLFQNDAIARRDMEQSETDAVAAESDRDAALLQLRALGLDDAAIADIRANRPLAHGAGIIRAPIEGTLVERLITPGQLLQAGATPCFTVADLSRMWIMANVFDSDLPFVGEGDPAVVSVPGGSVTVPGKVDYVSALVDPGSRAVDVRIVARNPEGVLRKDLYVRVAIQSHRVSEGLLVPVSAVLRDDENLPFVYVQTAGGSGYLRRRVAIGARVDDHEEVTSGLKAGEQIVVEGGLFMQFAENQ